MERRCLHCRQALNFVAAVRGEIFCSSDHRELYLQAQSTAAYERVIEFDNPAWRHTAPPTEPLMCVVERIKSRKAAAQLAANFAATVAVAKTQPPIPIALVEDEFLRPVKRRRLARLWASSGIAASVAILVLAATFFESSRKGANSFSPLVLAAESRVNKPVEPALPPAVPAPMTPVVTRPSMSENMGEKRHVSIRVKETTWLAACSDNQEVLRRILSPADTREFDYSERAIVRVGNAGGTDISVDGKSIGPIGPAGALRVIEIGRRGFHLLSVDANDNGRDCGRPN